MKWTALGIQLCALVVVFATQGSVFRYCTTADEFCTEPQSQLVSEAATGCCCETPVQAPAPSCCVDVSATWHYVGSTLELKAPTPPLLLPLESPILSAVAPLPLESTYSRALKDQPPPGLPPCSVLFCVRLT